MIERGLGRYYDLAGDNAGTPIGEAESRPVATLAWLEPLLERSRARVVASPTSSAPGLARGLESLAVDVQGIHCSACVWLMEETFRRADGAGSIVVNPSLGRVDLAFAPGRFDVAAWIRDLEGFGYRFGPPHKLASKGSTDLPLRLGISAALAINIMLFSVSFYFGLAPADGEIFRLFTWLSAVLASVVVVVGGWPFFRAAIASLRRGVAHLDLPIALGIVLVFATSLGQLRDGRGDLAYFDTLAVFITLMVAGRFLQERVIERNRRYLLEDDGVDSLVVRRLDADRPRTVAASQVRLGDRLLVSPGELVPVPAVVTSVVAGAVSRDWIDGESEPRAVGAGDEVVAGSFNAGSTALEVVAMADFADSPLVSLLGRGSARRPTQRRELREQIGRYWVAGVLTAAALGLALWLPVGLDPALEVAAAVLVVTCPCAIGIALPLAQELTLHRLRRFGFFVRERGLLERLSAVRTILFDKTGTLTLRRLELEAPEHLAKLDAGVLGTAYDLAVRSSHPAARAIAAALEGVAAQFDPTASTHEVPGLGVELTRDGARWRLGKRSWATGLDSGDGTVLSRDGVVVADFALREVLRPDAKAEIRGLVGQGYGVWLLSGDQDQRVARLAAGLGIPPERALGGLSPEDKAARVRALDHEDTLFLGDGVNDALAFAAAYTAGTPAIDRPVLPGRSDFFVVGEGIAPLAAAFAASRDLRRVTHQLLGASLGYNLLAVAASLAGWVTPLIAAVVMPTSTLLLVAYTVWRLERAGRVTPAAKLDLVGAAA